MTTIHGHYNIRSSNIQQQKVVEMEVGGGGGYGVASAAVSFNTLKNIEHSRSITWRKLYAILGT